MTLSLPPLLITMPRQLLDRRLGQHLGLPQMRATPFPSPSTITTPLASSQSTPSHFPLSLNTPPHSVSSPLSPSCQLQQGSLTAIYTALQSQYLALVPGQHAATAMLSMTALHTGYCPMATAPLPFMPTGHDQSVLSMQSPSLLTFYYAATHRHRGFVNTASSDMEKKKTPELNCLLGPEDHLD